MFVRKKRTSSGTVKHYLVETHRENGKVRQKVLFYLGDHATVEERLAWLDTEVDRHHKNWHEFKQMHANRKNLIYSQMSPVDQLMGRRPRDERTSDPLGDAAHFEFEKYCEMYRAALQLREIIRSAQSETRTHV